MAALVCGWWSNISQEEDVFGIDVDWLWISDVYLYSIEVEESCKVMLLLLCSSVAILSVEQAEWVE